MVIKYNKGTSNKVVNMFSRTLVSTSVVFKNTYLSQDSSVEQNITYEYFKYVYEKLTHGSQVENYHLQGKFLYNLRKLCIPTIERVDVI